MIVLKNIYYYPVYSSCFPVSQISSRSYNFFFLTSSCSLLLASPSAMHAQRCHYCFSLILLIHQFHKVFSPSSVISFLLSKTFFLHYYNSLHPFICRISISFGTLSLRQLSLYPFHSTAHEAFLSSVFYYLCTTSHSIFYEIFIHITFFSNSFHDPVTFHIHIVFPFVLHLLRNISLNGPLICILLLSVYLRFREALE